MQQKSLPRSNIVAPNDVRASSFVAQHKRSQTLPPFVKSVSPVSIPSTLEYENLGERNIRQPWLPDHQAQGCMEPGCPTVFSITERRHHCRCCGKIFCSTHTGYQSLIDSDVSVDRVCNPCFSLQESKMKERLGSGKYSSQSAGFLHYVSRERLQEKQVVDESVLLERGTVASNAFIAGVEITHALEPAYIVDVRARRKHIGNQNKNNNSNIKNVKYDGESPPFNNNTINNDNKYHMWCVRRHFSDFLYLVKTMKYGIDLSNFRKSTPDLNDPYALKSSIELLNNVLALCLRSKWRNNITVQTFLCDSPMRRNHVVPKEIIGKQLIEKGNLDSFPLVVLRAEIIDGHKSPHVAFVICTRSIENTYEKKFNDNDADSNNSSTNIYYTKETFHIVKRRYTYFQILNQQLKKKFPKRSNIGKELPSLPGKSIDPIGGSRFHAARIEKKRFNLELYLHELLLIPEVRVSDEVKTFLGVTPIPLDSDDGYTEEESSNYTDVNETKANYTTNQDEYQQFQKRAGLNDSDKNDTNQRGQEYDAEENNNFSSYNDKDVDENDVNNNMELLCIQQNQRNNESSTNEEEGDVDGVHHQQEEQEIEDHQISDLEISQNSDDSDDNNNNFQKVKRNTMKKNIKDSDEDARKTKTAKFIAELLKRSLEAKLDLAAKESEYEALKKELNVVKTECVNERTLRLAAEKENSDLRKQLEFLNLRNEKYPRGQLQKYWQEKS
jgi:hypothetical protein